MFVALLWFDVDGSYLIPSWLLSMSGFCSIFLRCGCYCWCEGWCYFTFFSKNLALCLHMVNISSLLLSDVLVSAFNMWTFSAMHRLQCSPLPQQCRVYMFLQIYLILFFLAWIWITYFLICNLVQNSWQNLSTFFSLQMETSTEVNKHRTERLI